MSYLATQKSSKEEIKQVGAWLLYLYNGLLQTLWFLNLLIRHVLKCTTLIPANPALPMVEVAVLLVVKKRLHASGEQCTHSTEETICPSERYI